METKHAVALVGLVAVLATFAYLLRPETEEEAHERVETDREDHLRTNGGALLPQIDTAAMPTTTRTSATDLSANFLAIHQARMSREQRQ